MALFIRLLILLWLVNFAPPFLAQIFESKWNCPIDGGYLFLDGRPLFGRNKTIRGVLAGIITGGLIGRLWVSLSGSAWAQGS